MSQTHSYLFVTTNEPPNTRIRHEELAQQMRERLSDFSGPVAEIRETITDNDGVVYRPLETIFCEKWNRGRVLLIGDAVHTMTPPLGQGAGMAIEDAVVLGQELLRPRPLVEQISSFLARRVERCRKVTHLSVQTGEWEIENSHHSERFAMVREVLGVTAEPI
jgi:2-polyprenyl-6-methoxyphenol hydroxylase-like FAD-dependent oxidoreductase